MSFDQAELEFLEKMEFGHKPPQREVVYRKGHREKMLVCVNRNVINILV